MATVVVADPPLAVVREHAPSRLLFLDGIRGLAALYVVLHHAYLEIVQPLPPGFPNRVLFERLLAPLRYGHHAVAVFIVLSGYCLMLPIVRSGSLPGGFPGYVRRRVRRILPAYFAALALCLAVIRLVPAMQVRSGLRWDVALPITKGAVVSHLLLLHNLRPQWNFGIDPPMWSVATEWQIYFALPLLLLPIWRRFGNGATVAVALGLGIGLSRIPTLYMANFPYLGLFAFGMAAAQVRRVSRRNILLLAAAVFAGWCAAVRLPLGTPAQALLLSDLCAGALAACVIVACAVSDVPQLRRVFTHRSALALGSFSYSLYLVHYPVLSLCHVAALHLHLPPLVFAGWEFAVGVTTSLAAAYLFHLAFERPFLSKKSAS